MKITAAVSRGAASGFAMEQVRLDDPRPDEILVRLVAVGVCHTDLATKSLYPDGVPVVLGHEGAGIVESVGADVSGVRAGDHVLLSFASCGVCPQCRADHRAYCERFQLLNSSGRRADGSATISDDAGPISGSFFGQSSFATHALATRDNVVVVDDDLDLTVAAPFGCGIQTGAGAVINVLEPGTDSRVVVFGAGGVGMAAIMAAKALGVVTIVAVDLAESRRDIALSVGATHVIDGAADDVAAQILEATGGGATHAFDTTGVGAVINTAIRALAPLGTLVIVGLGAQLTIDPMALISGGKTIRGSIEGDAQPQDLIPQLVRWHAEGLLPIERIVTPYPFADIDRAVADARSGVTIKPVLTF
jgi:aryl-alcohol dehydrogenase